ncbi:MAG: nicotinate phosphoribosyltransferase [Streptosporangiales bacterium]|nr:nicotinate phosphoribosyltransferase [Streptosporangiales bacterium]MBO0892061.1 nicotinate phosphoribosyltransferase [Acidothermales bacterium]
MLTDQYEVTMLRSALRDGTAARRCVFELFARRLPGNRRYGVVAGTGRLLELLTRFTFDDDAVRFLRECDVIDDETADWLRSYRFRGDIWGYAEGDVFFPGSPLLVVEASFAEAVLLETLALSVLNHDCAIASAASRMVTAAGDRPVIEMGSRRTHEAAAVASARAAYLAGFASTSNLEAGRRYGIPTAGTVAHAFVLLHERETDAFRAQVEALGSGTTILVDTYDVRRAVRAAVEVAGTGLGAIRIDSGDLLHLAGQVRDELDELGAHDTRIVVSGDLDEHQIAALAVTPAASYGVGTSLVTGSGAPTAELVYKLVARGTEDPDAPLEPVAKTSIGKPTRGGRKWAFRRTDEQGVADAELINVRTADMGNGSGRPLLVPLVENGEPVWDGSLDDARKRLRASLAELPPTATQLSQGEPAIPTYYVEQYS